MTTLLTRAEIEPLVDAAELIDAIEDGFRLYSEGRVTVPPVGFLHFDDPPGDVHIKYGYIAGDEHYVLKMASGFYDNAAKGLPPSDGVILVSSQKSGALELVLHDECWLTDMRTAAAGAVAARHLAPERVECIGIVGTGVQARMQLRMLRTVVDCDRALVWGRSADRAQAMIDELRADPDVVDWGLELDRAESVEDLAARCNLIVTTTPSKEPLLRAEQVRPGTHVTAMGSDDDGKQELEAALLTEADRVVADSVAQCTQYGECVHAVRDGLLDQSSIVELGRVIADPKLGRTTQEQITVADLTGVAIQDIQIAKMVLRKRGGEP